MPAGKGICQKNRSAKLLKENGMNDVIYAIVTYENGAIACMGSLLDTSGKFTYDY